MLFNDCLWLFFSLSINFNYLWCCCCLLSIGIEANASPDYSPSSYSYHYRRDGPPNNNEAEIDLGTTLVAIKYSKGVVVGADTRTSAGGYVSNKFAYKINKIFELEDYDSDHNDDVDPAVPSSASFSSCVLCRSGSAADTQWLAQNAKRQFRRRSLERPHYRPTISEVAHYLRYLVRDTQNHDSSSLQASLICAGYNAVDRKGQIYCITPGGSLWEEDHFCVSGSGSTVLLGYLDSLFDTKDVASTYTEEETIELVTKLLRLSISRDGSSGGLIRLYVINENIIREHTIYPFAKHRLFTPRMK